MEMFKRLSTTMYKILNSLVALGCILTFLSCNNTDITVTCTIKGKIISNGIQPNGIKITFENVSDPSLKYIVVSDASGIFEILEMEPGTYYVDAIKEGLEFGWVKDEESTILRDRLIDLRNDLSKNLTIYVKGNPYNSNFDLELTDLNGTPIGNSIHIPKFSTTVSFRLYNGTNESRYWTVSDPDKCFVSDDIGYKYEYIFNSFSQTEGTLKPGDAIVLVGIINQKIFSIYKDNPHFLLNELNFYSDFKSKSVYLDIEF